MPIKMYYTVSSSAKTINIGLSLEDGLTKSLSLSSVIKAGNDWGICVDMKTHLVEGVNSRLEKTGNLYNRYITSGYFFMVPVGLNTLTSNTSWNQVTFNYLYY